MKSDVKFDKNSSLTSSDTSKSNSTLTSSDTSKSNSTDDVLDHSIMTEEWFQKARTEGICLVDWCGNLATAAETVLLAGWKVKQYYYCDTNPQAKIVARATLSRLTQEYPHQFPESAWGDWDKFPDDIGKWKARTIKLMAEGAESSAWLVCCGWPCQDNSPAGNQLGEEGTRSTLITSAIIPLIKQLQAIAPMTAYLLENTAIQYNWKDPEKWARLLRNYCRMMGSYVYLDATRVGSAAHRPRDYWTNLSDPTEMQQLIDRVVVPTRPLSLSLSKGVELCPVAKDDPRDQFQINFKDKPRKALPTFTSRAWSRAFRLTDKYIGGGMLYDKTQKPPKWREPWADEKADIMGHSKHVFSGSQLSENAKLHLIGNAWDMRAALSLLVAAESICCPRAHICQLQKAQEKDQSYFYRLDDWKNSPAYQQNNWEQLLEKTKFQSLKDTNFTAPVIPVQIKQKANQRRGLGFWKNLAKKQPMARPPITIPQNKSSWWRAKFVKHEPATINHVLCAECPPLSQENQEKTSIMHANLMQMEVVPDLQGQQADKRQLWDPWEHDGQWLRAMSSPMGKLATRLSKEQPGKWNKLMSDFELVGTIENETISADVQLWKLSKSQFDRRLVPPPVDRLAIIKRIHHQNGHFGIARTTSLVGQGYWMPQMHKLVSQVVKTCEACANVKASFDGHNPVLQPLPIMGLCYRWSVDLATMPYVTKRGHKYIMIIVEHYSKYIELVPLPTKEPKYTAAAFRERVIARYGGSAEVLTDNGGEFAGEFDVLMAHNLIDHRLITPHHSQSNGLAERCVQTVKRSLKKMATDSRYGEFQWDDELPYVMLAYNVSAQESTKLAPYTLMLGHEPYLPNEAVAAKLKAWNPLDKEDLINNNGEAITKAAADLQRRIELFKKHQIIVGYNLRIAQHRDTLRYATVRGGEHRYQTHQYTRGQFVWLRRKGADSLQLKSRGIYKVAAVLATGLIALEGSDGKVVHEHPQFISPCHVPVELITAGSAIHREVSDELACQVCGSMEDEASMLICDGCEMGWHMQCLEPPMTEVPDDTWFCPVCVAGGKTNAVRFRREPDASTPARFWADGRPVFRVPEAEGMAYHGKLVKHKINGKWYHGTVQFVSDPDLLNYFGLFRVKYHDGDEGYLDLPTLLKDPKIQILAPVDSEESPLVSAKESGMCQKTSECDKRDNHRGRCNAKLSLSQQVLLLEDEQEVDLYSIILAKDSVSVESKESVAEAETCSHENLDSDLMMQAPVGVPEILQRHQVPFTWMVSDSDAWSQMLQSLMPHPQGRWPKSTCTRLVKDVQAQRSRLRYGPFQGNRIRHATVPEEVYALLPHIKWKSLSTCLDPMSGTNTISTVLQSSSSTRHVRVFSNDWDDSMQSDSHDDALQPRSWVKWAARWAVDAVITSPYFAFLDVMVPLMLLFVPVLIVHVPSTWLFSATQQRRRWLQEQYSAGKIHVISNLPRGAPGPWRCCWVVFTQTSDLLKAVVVDPAGLSF